jgi:4'-phosphopantetheinyl transferase EntD
LALKRLLLLDDDDDDGLQQQQMKSQQQKKKSQQKLNQKLWEEIITNPIQKDSFGRPILPELVVGSISHKGNYAVGLAAFHPDQGECKRRVEGILCDREEDDDDDDYHNKIIRWREDCPIYYNDDGSIITSSTTSSSSGSNSNSDDNNNDGSSSNNNINQGRIGIGIDLERIDDTRGDRIQRKVLTKNEQSELGGLVDSCGISIGEEVTLRFSLKESVYKAMHPILCEYVGFQEAEITPLPNGSAKVTLNLQSGSHERLGIVIRSISWRRLDDGFFLTTALVGCDGGVPIVRARLFENQSLRDCL